MTRQWRPVIGTLLICLAIASCASESADDVVDSYLRALTASQGDFGWHLLHVNTRRDMFSDGFEAYSSLVRTSDLAGFSWRVSDVAHESNDLYFVFLEIPGGKAAIPRVLVDANGYSLLAYDEQSGVGQMNVLVAFGQDVGIVPAGVAQNDSP